MRMLGLTATGMVVMVLIVFFWVFHTYVGLIFHQAPDPVFDGGEHYDIWSWPGSLMNRDVPDRPNANLPVADFVHNGNCDTIDRIGRSGDFIVGRTNYGWFAIDYHSGKIWYPFPSSSELKASVGVQFDESHISTRLPWGLMRWRPGVWKVPATNGLLCVVSLIAFGVIWVRFCRRVLTRQSQDR
jgi:hypothetical protein